ncbi:hypothetical protein Tco_0015708 [Tanacetum coccineum]
MQNFLKNDIVWESRKEILFSPHLQNPTLVVQSCQRDPKAPALSLVNQDLLYLKKGNLGPEKIVMSLHKFPTVIFPDDDIEERTFRWVDKCVKKFNPYARYSVEHWKNPHAKIFYIKKKTQKAKGSKIIARRANGSIVSITKSDYKNLNKIDIEDLYLLIVNNKLGVESYQQKVNLTAPTITFPGIEKYKMFSIVSEPVYGIKYKNSKKEKRVMRNQEVHKFCDATLKRALEGLKNYNNNVKHGYVTPSLNKEDDEYLQLFEEEIEERISARMKEIKELSANICLMAGIQPVNFDSNAMASYDSAFLSENPKLYDASCLDDSKIHVNVRDTEDILDDATKRLSAASSVRIPLNRDSPLKNSVLSNTKKSSEKVEVSVRTNKKTYVASKNVDSNKKIVVQIILWIVDSGCSKHMTGQGHNLFSVGQFRDGDLEVSFRSNTCYVRNLEGDDLLTRARESNLYTISILDMAASSPVCLFSKATSTKSWLWHHRLLHL